MGESTVFVVRVWRDVQAFRATARAVDHENVRIFSEPLALLRFLAPSAPSVCAPVADKGLPTGSASNASDQPERSEP